MADPEFQDGADPFGIDHPTEPGYWIEVDPSGWPHKRIPVTPGWRLQWVPWKGDGPVPPFRAMHEAIAAIQDDEAYDHWWQEHGQFIPGNAHWVLPRRDLVPYLKAVTGADNPDHH